jgi:hypothetical protein
MLRAVKILDDHKIISVFYSCSFINSRILTRLQIIKCLRKFFFYKYSVPFFHTKQDAHRRHGYVQILSFMSSSIIGIGNLTFKNRASYI